MDFDVVNDHLTGAIYGTDVHYGGSDDPRVGRFVADRPLKTDSGPTRLAELLREGRPLLLDLTGTSTAARIAHPWTDRVRTVAVLDTDAEAEAAALLIRPDGYLAWAADAPVRTPAHAEDLRTALTSWFGDPISV
ncbi:hypothetical protein [Streptomyces sp. cg2]|uniref:aromatic-ring hydroxylase C-terminal domain-containing protein n=1 Tax=Streptomyces sp. cg2 TaxID=3238799 RepID=UPI0034E27D00